MGQSTCTACGSGKYNPYTESISEDACVTCEVGYTSTEGSSICSPCAPGFYREASQSSCTPCAAGKYSSSYGSSSKSYCFDCPLGSSNPYVGQSSCALCLAGTFANTTGLAYCHACGSSSYSVAGATKCDSCSS